MKKLSKILESTWGDIARRAEGEQVRQEDNVDFLEPDDFIAYIRKIYRIDNTPYDIANHTNGLAGTGVSNIFIPICTAGTKNIKLGAIYFDYNNGEVYTHSSIKKYIPELWTKLDRDFDLWIDPNYQNFTNINPKDKSRKVNNSYVLELLNYICDNLDDTVTPCLFRKTNESTWGDMARRAEGEQVRKEDDVQFMDATAFCKYCEKRYTITGYSRGVDYTKKGNEWERVEIPGIYTKGAFLFFYLVFHSNGEKTIPIAEGDLKKMPEIKKRLEQEFMLKSNYDHWVYEVFPKDGSEVTNQFFIDFVDFCLDNFNSPDIKKFASRTKGVNESTWGDMARRAEGEQIRREDIPEKNPQYWWRDIPHPAAPKYKKEELRGLDIIYNFVISKIEKALNIEWPDEVRVYFSDEPYWYLSLEHVTPYGSDTYTINLWGTKGGYNPETWSEMLIPEKRGIRYRLEKRKLYLYPGNPNGGKIRDFVVRDIDEFKGKKGIELK